MLVGPAGSGKTTWAEANLGPHVVSADRLRALAGEGEDDLRASTDAFRLLDDLVEVRLRRGLTTVIDTLGTDAARRAGWRAAAERAGVPCVAVVFDVPPAEVRRRNKGRTKRVPEAVLRAQLAEWRAVTDAVAAEPFAAVHVLTDDAAAPAVSLVAPALIAAETAAADPPGPAAARAPCRSGCRCPASPASDRRPSSAPGCGRSPSTPSRSAWTRCG